VSPATIVYATADCGVTLDTDAAGGNPFATALIETTGGGAVAMEDWLPQVRARTRSASAGRQDPVWALRDPERRWMFKLSAASRTAEQRVALVLIVSDYSARLSQTLAGAAFDERRIAALLAQQGFSVVQGVAPERAALRHALKAFARQSRHADAAVIYATGHGLSHRGQAYLLPANYPFSRPDDARLLARHGVAVSEIALACQAHQANVVFFAACRTTLSA
jgi:Caspase domain